MKRTGGKQFDPKARRIYFIASTVSDLVMVQRDNRNMLIAVNELSPKTLPIFSKMIDDGINVLIDSGVFHLAMEHVRKTGCTLPEALSLAPNEITGYDKLHADYINTCKTLGEKSWGYIEIDQGGRENKTKTRTALEAMGLRPIPVYHPLNDGWEYFDFLAEQYDRICIGNIVNAEPQLRKRIITTVFERQKQKYPDLWMHLLGVTPYTVTHSCPSSSCDSSTWLASVRWSDSATEWACGQATSKFGADMVYVMADDNGMDDEDTTIKGRDHSKRLHAMQAHMLGMNWRAFIKRMEELTA